MGVWDKTGTTTLNLRVTPGLVIKITNHEGARGLIHGPSEFQAMTTGRSTRVPLSQFITLTWFTTLGNFYNFLWV